MTLLDMMKFLSLLFSIMAMFQVTINAIIKRNQIKAQLERVRNEGY